MTPPDHQINDPALAYYSPGWLGRGMVHTAVHIVGKMVGPYGTMYQTHPPLLGCKPTDWVSAELFISPEVWNR